MVERGVDPSNRHIHHIVNANITIDMLSAEVNVEKLRNLVDMMNTVSQSTYTYTYHEIDYVSPVWDAILEEARAVAIADLEGSAIVTNLILSQPSFKEAVISHVANQLATPLLQATQIRNIFDKVVSEKQELPSLWALDILASITRSNKRPTPVRVLMFNPGFHSLVAHRVSNYLWETGRTELALYFQSLVSRIFKADIHPACRIGSCCYLSEATSVVLGETCVVGDDVSIRHGVTLGGSGKESGDRHPKVGDAVILSSGSTVLGNTRIGDGAIIDAKSVVTKDVLPYTQVECMDKRRCIDKFIYMCIGTLISPPFL